MVMENLDPRNADSKIGINEQNRLLFKFSQQLQVAEEIQRM